MSIFESKMDNEAKIRKQWLALQITSVIAGCMSVFFPVMTQIPEGVPSWTLDVTRYFTLAGSLCFQYLLYHYAYKKKGLKLLTFFLVITPIGLIATVASHMMSDVPLTAWGYFFTAFQFGLSIFWFFVSLKLRTFNKQQVNL